MTSVRFGTDGIRGVAGETITEELAAALGQALGSRYPGGKILIGRDTRASGERLSASLAAGIAAGGARPVDEGVIPTSGLAIITARDVTVVRSVAVTASHNPAEYNGLKVIGRNGRKVADDEERELEGEIGRLLAAGASASTLGAASGGVRTGVAPSGDGAEYRQRYVEVLATAAADVAARGPVNLRVVVDAAHGAGAPYALDALTRTGAAVVPFAMGNGSINDSVGATAPAALAREVLRIGADLGVALDGDADRCVAVDEKGAVVDGDVLIGLIALDRRARGLVGSDRVVATVLTNSGVERALAHAGISLTRTPVGDRHIAEALDGASEGFGGEKSGHLLFAERAPTGDGLLSAIELIDLLARSRRSLASLAAEIPLDPQIQASVRVPQGSAEQLLATPALAVALRAATSALEASGGRLLARASGTEPLLRVMAEGPDAEQVRRAVEEVTAAAEALLRGR
jgi:phosphoglucosamine mutase